MASNFVGLSMLVTLISPPGAQVRGIVSRIEPGKSLTLRDVIYIPTGKLISEFTIKATEIIELVEAIDEDLPSASTLPQSTTTVESKTFEDPAILSLGRRPIPTEKPTQNTLESSSSQEPVVTPKSGNKNENCDVKPVESLIRPISNISLAHTFKENKTHSKQPALEDENILSQSPKTESKSKRRPRRRKGVKEEEEEEVDQKTTIKAQKSVSKTNGWRQTPLLELNPSFQPFSTLKRKVKCREEEGWGTEDATDVQELGDFDFEGGLAKFDKNKIFNQLQAEDGIAAEDRLVSLNISSRVKSYSHGSKNLHLSENFIDKSKLVNSTPTFKAKNFNDLSSNTDKFKENSPQESENSRRIRHNESIPNSNRRPIGSKPLSGREISSTHPSSSRSYSLSRVSADPAFFIVTSGHRCEHLSPLQMLNLEDIASNELGLSEDMMAENSGRSVAEVAFSAISSGGNGLTKSNSPLHPTIVVLVGNNKNGLRAVAAARHMQNRLFNVFVCIPTLEQESELLAGLRLQLKIFRNFGGKVMNKVEFFEFLRQYYAPIELIIDGLLGLATSFEELRLADQSNTYELISWANRSKAAVLAIDIPAGIDPTNGEVSIIDGRPLYLFPKFIVALGVPKRGLLEAMVLDPKIEGGEGLGRISESQLFVADIGLGEAVWQKAGTKIRKGIDFDNKWVLRMRFNGVDE
ncbi:Enhancer of mRNA-decapping protein 3 [Golovinomyces cichoracearum]|uniref:Enhancer of mRNA-decapping protein 3 n=1 Tax=Golovinomyces cichoracearum TaxID=62708 RepID=A0A420J1I1_9PEZI|nr:Enhancer of mRNA-decapping protein 3 [Golovinomyces cichoracearum]